MKKKTVSGIMLTLLFTGILTLAWVIQQAKADWTWTETIYIRADGSIEPDTAPVESIDNITYTLTDNITGDVPYWSSAVVVERDNIVVDGANHTISGTGVLNSRGINLSGRSNVTIKNMEVKSFHIGIYLYESSLCNIHGNNITSNERGVFLSAPATSSSYNITISGNNITSNNYQGIYVYESSNSIISGNNIKNSKYGIILGNSDDNFVNGNYLANNQYALYLSGSADNNSVDGNYLENNEYGIRLHGNKNNDLSENMMNDNEYNFYVIRSSDLSSYLNSIDSSNLANGKPIYYLVNQADLVINHATHPQVGYLGLINCYNITVEGLTVTNNGQGFLLAFTNNSRILNNTLTNNANGLSMFCSSNNTVSWNNMTRNDDDGFELDYNSSNNTFQGNSITYNSGEGGNWWKSYGNTFTANNVRNNRYGLYLARNCSDNKFYHNNFVNNTHHVHISNPESSYGNKWDNGYPFGGNYWSDYSDVDRNSGPGQDVKGSDGIWDHPYSIDADDRDSYPLTEPWSTPTTHTFTLSRTTKSWNLRKGTEKKLTTKLKGVLRHLDKGKESAAIHKLMGFVKKVEALRDKKLTNEQADYLTSETQRIIDLIKG